jgi:hypothetical protein
LTTRTSPEGRNARDFEAGEGRHKVWLKVEMLDDGVVCILGGGERSHVGGVAIAEPGATPFVHRRSGHHDDVVLLPIAEAACRKYNMAAAALGGVHVDRATKEDLNILIENCRELARCI